MTPPKISKVALEPGKGIATKNTLLEVRAKVSTGSFLLIHDSESNSGGAIHFLENETDPEGRLRRLRESIQARKPVAKIVGVGEPTDIFQVLLKRLLQEAAIPVVAESVSSDADVRVLCRPAVGDLKVKRSANAVPAPAAPIRVLIVDDAPVIRKVLRHILLQDPAFELVGEAGSTAEADELLRTLTPDVMTMDIHMPKEDGVSYLRRLYSKRFVPAVIVSSLSMEEGEHVLEALSLGAIDYVQKPAFDELAEVADLIRDKLKVAARVRERPKARPASPRQARRKKDAVSGGPGSSYGLIAIGASTGGVQALTEILTQLPAEIPPIVIVQHIPAGFSRAFCERLDRECPFRVKEAEDGDQVLPGQVLIAPGGLQMKLERRKGKLVTAVFDGERVNRHKPSVEVLFQSVANEIGGGVLGIMLTGMGEDGAKGMLEMRHRGASTIAQDELSSVVWGMPGAAVRIGAAERVLPLSQITIELLRRAKAA